MRTTHLMRKITFALFLVFGLFSTVVAQKSTLPKKKGKVAVTATKRNVKAKTPVDSLKTKTISNPKLTTPIGNIALVSIHGGTFVMGSPLTEVDRGSNEKQHTVTVSSFRMSKYEITNTEYAAFLNAKGIGIDGIYAAGAYPTQTLVYPTFGTYNWGLNYIDGKWIPAPGFEKAPVTSVTWYGAVEFATYVGGMLPTEAQWEYACRAGTTTPYNTGDYLTNLQANYYWAFPYNGGTNTKTTYPAKPQPVGLYPPNAFGLYDMHGNVWEWCSDWEGKYPGTAQNNPQGPTMGVSRIYRGGSWSNEARYCRSADRAYIHPERKRANLGFRIVLAP